MMYLLASMMFIILVAILYVLIRLNNNLVKLGKDILWNVKKVNASLNKNPE